MLGSTGTVRTITWPADMPVASRESSRPESPTTRGSSENTTVARSPSTLNTLTRCTAPDLRNGAMRSYK
ncbi:hypothetical protein [Sphaerisporangium corydalis]|uniref:Uncharacterized protein n=1 Tax=Sphaerisporangium corydalis TaxID=1441875 RepID=A0ABV9EP68_9ACTN|nr:hypothetical protein [Sphaerisporangium corydalis]